ncbi:MAG: 50S ribosomal protein L30 [Candidatus Odinarchaeia archaeon]
MDGSKLFAVLRVRGTVDIRGDIEDTLKMLRLHKPNHVVLVDNRPSYVKMLEKVKDYVTWGEIDLPTLCELIKKRGRLRGNKKITEEYVKDVLNFNSIEDLAKALLECKVALKDLQDVKPVFRLHPPRKGFEAKKKPFTVGGTLGYRGKAINNLLIKMM